MTLGPSLKTGQLVRSVLARVRNPQPDGSIIAHQYLTYRGLILGIGFTLLVYPRLDSPINELPTSAGKAVAVAEPHWQGLRRICAPNVGIAGFQHPAEAPENGGLLEACLLDYGPQRGTFRVIGQESKNCVSSLPIRSSRPLLQKPVIVPDPYPGFQPAGLVLSAVPVVHQAGTDIIHPVAEAADFSPAVAVSPRAPFGQTQFNQEGLVAGKIRPLNPRDHPTAFLGALENPETAVHQLSSKLLARDG